MAAAAAPRGRRWEEARELRRAVGLLQRLEEQCGDPRLASGPPSLRDLLPRTAQLLRDVAHARQAAGGGGPEDPGGARDFLIVYVHNLEAKSRQVAALLPSRGDRGADDELFREGSRLRRQLAKLALIFSYMHAELGALFPKGEYCGHTYKLTKASAHNFWRRHCGARCMLPWAEFESLLCTCHPVESGATALALRSTINLTCSGHVSIFEFDIFTRLFQPWPTLLKNWQLLAVNHPGYMAFLTYDEVQVRLQACRDKPGSYIFRPSCTRLGHWAIGYVSSDGSILQTIPLNKPLFQALLDGQKEGFYLYPNGRSHNPDLTELYQMEPHQYIHVSEEQLQLYWAMNSTFELCKICAEGNKDVKIKPCGHLLCSRCLAAWQNSDSQTCPFCRTEIKGHEAVSVHQIQVRPAEARAAAEDQRENRDQADGEEELGQVASSAPPQPPQLNVSAAKDWLKVVPPALPRLQGPIPLPRIKTVALAPWQITSSPQAREGATGNS
ncbi:E3 ubiquitin-protein ligase CBL-C isoform X1 [Canis lupus familiaris]|uniref:LOW QUALITY PROTEIN: E3 ubiquitin-protein ligase CBL-C n=1 Tax=Canis lupus dingo TaxID=286419 RepID=UPI000DC68F1C|nr:LOW QUALITY PROTEIN: E3 ubiquitin-protein ligase CBL-C [Canis lupus dingo]XP_038384550.1 E3 ubiquitin-protein ligase CBL-C isoform X1 [Canis lupus familiaris]